MIVRINPSKASGRVTVPPSKSYAHRMLIAAGLSAGESTIENVQMSQDILATLDCLTALGAKIKTNGSTVKITGADLSKVNDDTLLNSRECGTTIRLFVPICLTLGKKIRLTGSEKLLSRPMSVYETIAREQGLEFINDGKEITVSGKLSCTEYNVPGNVSSQFISGLMYALPLLEGDSVINIEGRFESYPYALMTIMALQMYGVNIEEKNHNTFIIKGGQGYKAKDNFVFGDWSNAAFLYALKYMGNEIDIEGLSSEDGQGDSACVQDFEALKDGVPTIDVADTPDLAPILFAFAAMHNGATFTGCKRLRIKESDRIATMQEELAKYGATMEVGEDTVVVNKCELHKPEVALNGHNDHRIVMAMAVMLTRFGGAIDGAQAVSKSWPEFFEVLNEIGVEVSYEHEF